MFSLYNKIVFPYLFMSSWNSDSLLPYRSYVFNGYGRYDYIVDKLIKFNTV